MRSNLRPWWAALALTALIGGGCGSESAPEPGPSASPTVTPSTTTPPSESPAPSAAPAKDETKGAAAEPKIEGPKDEAPAAKGAADASKLSDEEIAEIKKLPAAEQPIALKQMVCPVSDEHLGAMGAPIKVTAEGKSFYICCKSCKEDAEKNAKDILAKLGNK